MIGPDNFLYAVIGDLNRNGKLQNFANGPDPDDSSVILRVNPADGSPAPGNPLSSDPSNPLSSYYAYGIRNSFGIDFDPVNNRVWETENGPNVPVTGNLWGTENGEDYGDEINLIEPGFNGGWNKIQGLWEIDPDDRDRWPDIGDISHDPEDLEDFDGDGRYSSPELAWFGTEGLTALRFLNSDKLGEQYENDMFVATFHTGRIYHFNLNQDRTDLSLNGAIDDRVVEVPQELNESIFGQGFGGITDMEVGPDGYLYMLALQFGGGDCGDESPSEPCIEYSSSNKGTIYRIAPSEI
jgi:glucose/arabinose dehydrogenase